MAQPIKPSKVALASGASNASYPSTFFVTYTGHTNTAAVLNASGTLTASAAFQNATLLNSAKTRKSLNISAASDSAGGYFGSDNTVSPTTGHFVPPGVQLLLEGYVGPLWAVAEPGAQPQKFYIQEI